MSDKGAVSRFTALILLILIGSSATGVCQTSNSVLLLVADSTKLTPSESNLESVCRFYGLETAVKNVSSIDSISFVQDTMCLYSCAAISDYVLEDLDSTTMLLLQDYLHVGGSLFVQDISDNSAQGMHSNLRTLTNGEITGAESQGEPEKYLVFSSRIPKMTDVFTGLTFSYPQPGLDQALLFNANADTASMIGSFNSANQYFCFFAQCRVGKGNVFACSAYDSIEWPQLRDVYNIRYGASILPAMMVLKCLYADKAWHSPYRFANLTIEDPALFNWKVRYSNIFSEMKLHTFHLTIAYIPQNFILKADDPSVEQLFASNPSYFSTIQHGDYHKGYEFFVYTSADSARLCAKDSGLCGFDPVPLKEQERLIVDGATKLYLMQKHSGLPVTRVMAFPYGICPEERTLELLREYNFHSSVNPQIAPLLLKSSDPSWDAEMRPSDMIYGSLPLLTNSHPYTTDSTHSGSQLAWGVFRLFAGMPALYYSHIGQIFPPASGFDSFADSMNALAVPPTWASLDSISTHLYLVKSNDDGSDSLWAFGNSISVQSSMDKMIHLVKQESANPALIKANVNGVTAPFSYNNGYIYLDMSVHAGSTTKVEFLYQHDFSDFSIGRSSLSAALDTIYVWVCNNGDSSGVCPVAVLDSTRDSLLGVSTQWVSAHDSTLYSFPSPRALKDANWIILDPAEIVDSPIENGSERAPLGMQHLPSGSTPFEFSISQNYPNPFNSSTEFQLQVPRESEVELGVYNAIGQRVKSLFVGRVQRGRYTLVFDGATLPSGVYFVRAVLKDGQSSERRSLKVTLLK